MEENLLKNVHHGLDVPGEILGLVSKEYQYCHYGCDGFDDRGWGCGYRTLQTLCSWIKLRQGEACKQVIPSIGTIQESLVEMEDKLPSFIGTKDWIGSFEVSLVVDFFFDVPCKIIHIRSGEELIDHINVLVEHFKTVGAPVMMGGDTDSSSKGILGVSRDSSDTYLLVLDPHFYGQCNNRGELQNDGWVKWRPLKDFCYDSFYNLCLPQYKER
ncbi:ufm1-specific protease 1-like [Lineus longissimus]|uniref:ufm1-specific protease 1-like n=1 Tax=Lineus longissimus TaxID=88925 RepID=UPI002B4D752E